MDAGTGFMEGSRNGRTNPTCTGCHEDPQSGIWAK
jgi:hypothetical protein